MNWYLDVLKKYAVFSGRARRQEYWMFVLFNVIAAIILSIIDAVIGSNILIIIYWLGVLVPSLAVAVRRLHDTDKSGWFLLIGLIPFVGGIILLVFMATEGKPNENQYGPNPKLAPAV
ncbi:DUF805 domain-containing protein [Streptomyces sp. NPDC058001]|uniref:DUF805 domain-containing protein n=1 Tax=Streptomyces sp. NPDC058001 TaxID=3346300 RepID=UPI0036E771B4